MSWDTYEKSVDGGSPIDLHEFVYGAKIYRFTSIDEEFIDGNSQVWSPWAIRCGEIVEDQAEGRADLTIETELGLPALGPFRDGVPYMEYSLYQVHAEDPNLEKITIFQGRATNVTYDPMNLQAVIQCSSYSSVLDELTLRKKCQVQCPHGIYTPDCGVPALQYKLVAQVTAVSGPVVVVNGPAIEGKDDDYFPGGYVEWVHSSLGVVEQRMVSKWDSNTKTATLVASASGLVPGSAISMYPGCDHTLTTCDTKFDNAPRYGGAPFKPDESPFGGKAVF